MNAPSSIYLDHNATSPLDPEVREEMDACARLPLGNPDSQHAPGRRARRLLEDAKERMAEILGASLTGPDADRLVLTSGGTEANNLAIFGLAAHQSGFALVSAIEHPSVRAAADELRRRGWSMEDLPVRPDGVVDLAPLAQLHQRPRFVSLMLGNNETGVLQPVAEAAAWCSDRGVPLHTDAVQGVGKIPVHFRELGTATLSFSAHKLHGPVGIGGLLVRHDVNLMPQLLGGRQQEGLRPGTQCVVLAVGMRKSLEIWDSHRQARQRHLAQLRDRFERRLEAEWPHLVIHGRHAARLPHTSNIAFPGFDRQALVVALDLAGVACSTGSACASGSSEPSPTLTAMRLPRELVDSSLRFSLGAFTTVEMIDDAVDRILMVLRQCHRDSAAPPSVARKQPASLL